ncbi:hypothetical protein BGW37DRAFT_115527 [Umbelopsis sp. PMI_123]|nr:hypothetical protein BGW37DRAFT_115527 [Umbelopsis sp. PMI_123]
MTIALCLCYVFCDVLCYLLCYLLSTCIALFIHSKMSPITIKGDKSQKEHLGRGLIVIIVHALYLVASCQAQPTQPCPQ